MKWTEVYHERLTTAGEAVAHIKSGHRVFLSGNCAVPQAVLDALVKRAPGLHGVEIVQVLSVGDADYVDPVLEGHLRVNTLFISDNVRQAVNEGRADFTPSHLSEVPRLFSSGTIPLDVALIQVTPPDEHGFCSFGIEVGVTKTAAKHADLVIAEINPHMPRTLGDAFIHITKIDFVVPVDYPLPEIHMGEPTELSKRIGKHVASLIEDGSTLQMGIGARLYSRTGGQLDFVRGAARLPGGKPIIALPARALTRGGESFSRIVPTLKPGAGVVTTRNDVHYVVTEFGVADLYGRSIRQRARALIDIAHPQDRESLERAAIELRYL